MTSLLSQRWSHRRASWRHPDEGGFDRRNYEVAELAEAEAKRFVVEHHYSGTYPAARLRYGLFRGSQLVGAAILSVPVQARVVTAVFPTLKPYDEALDLGRFCLLDPEPGNAESFFLAQAFRLAAARGLRGVVSFSDPMPRRRSDGSVVMPGHVGTIYQASNARYCGRATARSLVLLPDGCSLNDRATQKVRSQERGHEHVERRLCALGARPLRSGEQPAAWLSEALDAIGARKVRHQGNHRYAFALGSPSERRRLPIRLDSQPFPKECDA